MSINMHVPCSLSRILLLLLLLLLYGEHILALFNVIPPQFIFVYLLTKDTEF
jgi:hypothetical protein